ncbi:MAG: arsenate reductase/protein-tyrosine-phosphatase family protein [Longimicrobiales bacterium]
MAGEGRRGQARPGGALHVEILVTEGCPNSPAAIRRTREVLEALAPDTRPEVRTVRDREEALALEFPGSPTVRINGVDLEGPEPLPPALACRRYGNEGAPPSWLIEAALLRALAPRHLLFLCVANSARSQMAEGVARSLAEGSIRISSAGSVPTRIRPEAVQVLAEIGIDATSQSSKGVDEVEGEVDAVVTLCAEEVCPAWLGKALRVHWGLPDPAGVTGGEEARLQAFRDVRDELRRRLGIVFGKNAV